MAGSGLNYGLAYICPDRTNTWLGIIACLRLLIYNLLYSSAGNLYLLDLINSVTCGLAPDNLALKLANNRPNIPPFSPF